MGISFHRLHFHWVLPSPKNLALARQTQEALCEAPDLLPDTAPAPGDTRTAASAERGARVALGALGMRVVTLRPVGARSAVLPRVAIRRPWAIRFDFSGGSYWFEG